jgi:hypothetical protein
MFFYIPLNFGDIKSRGKLIVGHPGPWKMKEKIGIAIVNPRGCVQRSKTVIVES